MRLVSFGPRGAEGPAVLDGEELVPLAPLLRRLGIAVPDMNAVLGLWDHLAPMVADEVESRTAERLELGSVRLGPPVPRPVNVVGVGRNYGEAAPDEPNPVPILFAKPVTALIGPEDPIVRPAATETLDYEAELAVVIGRSGRHIAVRDVPRHVAGYTIGSDVTAFDVMFPGHADRPDAMPAMLLQQLRGKGHDTFLPLGPAIVTADEAGDPDDLEIITTVNGEERQRAHAADMLVGIDRLVAEVSAVLTLHPGDVILTGTPPGIGLQQDPPAFLAAGDVVEITIPTLGRLRNEIVDEPREVLSR
jgi:2-keto-4-pentenoate hydratase/2-oxohepta-3-ene-1,7-dioic acid hydratase in catechol pathway